MKFHHIPFFIMLSAILSNWISKFPGFEFVNWLPEFFALCAVLLTEVHIRVRASFVLIGGFLIWHGLSQYFAGIGIGTSSLIRVFFITGTMWYFLTRSNVPRLELVLVKQISLIYVLHVVFIIAEAVLIETGNTEILSLLSYGTYKPGMPDFYGQVPASLFNQSQAAGQLLVVSIIWLLSLYLGRRYINWRPTSFEVCLSLLAVFLIYIYPNTTSFIIGILLLFILVFGVPHCKSLFLRFLMVILFASLSGSIVNYSFFKFNVDEYDRAEGYIDAFTDPVYAIKESSLGQALFGFGDIKSIVAGGLEHADFGLGIIVLQSGLVVFSLLLVMLGLVLVNMLKKSFVFYNSKSINQGWIWLGTVNALIVFGYLVSLTHYTVVLQTGGAHLLSFHLAIVFMAIDNARSHDPVRRSIPINT